MSIGRQQLLDCARAVSGPLLSGVIFAAGLVGPATVAPAAATAATAPTTADAASPELDAVMKLLAARQRGHVTYTETQELSVLSQPLHSSGELLYVAPDHLEKRALLPRAETLIIDGDTLLAQRGHRTLKVPLREHPQLAPLAASLRATLAGDRAALQSHFRLQFSGNTAAWTLLLEPTDPELMRQVRRIRIEGAGDALRSFELVQANGDRSLLMLGREIPP
ncbi:MAG: outer membrane lipoprotein carrier protein LolA [Proteobacteria bacterium]|nr:outer membrane lipoprotein carrier protein LolA [Pseudomonadota bacterium]